jgi:predicted RNA-binding Zn ribbon-like protein
MTAEPDLIGGHLTLDFVNTVSWRLDPRRRVDRLPDFPALLGWTLRAGLVDRATVQRIRSARTDPAVAGRTLRHTRRMRETLHTVLTTALAGDPPDLRVLEPFLVDAINHATLDPALPLRWSVPVRRPEDLARRLALASLDLLRDPDLVPAVRCCAGAGCGWLFIDRSRSHTRRWCSSGDCGNRERVRRHYWHAKAAG